MWVAGWNSGYARRRGGAGRSAVIPAALAVLVLVAAAASPLWAQDSSAPTTIRVYAAFGPGALRPGVVVTSRVTGECFASSVADQVRADAWRCMSGNRIMDPCFEGYQGSQSVLACPASPWAAQVTLLTIAAPPTKGSANKDDIGGGLPWAMELRDGGHCVFLTGATAVVAGMRVNYGCTGGAQSIVGDVNRALPQWRVFIDSGRGTSVGLEGVAVAWY